LSFKKYIKESNDVKYPNGIYISVDLTSRSKLKVEEYIERYLPDLDKNSSLHCTLIYSAVATDVVPVTEKYKCKGKYKHFSLFGPSGDTLVVEVDAPVLTNRNKKLVKDYGYRSDYGDYKSHVTFGYHYKDDIKELPPLDFDIEFEYEHIEVLNPNWK